METLADRIAREGPLNELDAVGWAIRLAKRIESMHALGVTHGSVSPQCVQIEGKDRTARAYLVDLRRTSSNPSYHSPERLQGGALSQADDTWALACTLYAALTGSPPFSGANDDEVKHKVLAGSPAPLAVFDVGDDDLQHLLDAAFARDLSHRTSSVSALRAALEEWHPDPNVGGLPGLEDEDTEGGIDDDEDERTIMRPAPHMLAGAKLGAPPAAAPAPVPEAAAPAPIAAPKIAPPAAVPPPRASSPGAPRAALGSAPGVSPLAQPRPGAAARVVPPPRGSTPGLPAPVAPPPRASRPGAVPPARVAPSPDLPAPLASASSTGDFPAPLGPPPGLVDHALPPGDDEDEDEKTMMRAVPDQLHAVMAARTNNAARPPEPPRTNDAARSGAFAAMSPTKSGSFPAMSSSPALDHLDHDEENDAEEEATRMMQSPAFPAPQDDDDEQATIMRTPEEAERLHGGGGLPAPEIAASAPSDSEPVNFAATVALDALGLAPPPAEAPPPAATALDGGAQSNAAASLAGPPGPSAGGFSPAGFGGAPLAPSPFAPPLGAAPVAPPSRRGGAVWIAVIVLVLIAAGATFFFLRLR